MPPRQKGGAARAAAPAAKSELLLYGLLGIEASATPAEVHRAYRLRAREVHPDKNPGHEQEASEEFRQLRAAFETLSDPERRERYDRDGDDGHADGSDEAEALRRLVRSRFRPISPQEVSDFEREYRGSAEERCDVAAFARKHRGDVTQLFEHIMCSDPAEVERFVLLLQQLKSPGELPEAMQAEVKRTIPQLRRSATALAKRNKRERSEAQGSGIDALADQIRDRKRQRGWAASIVEDIEARYCKPAPSKRALQGAVMKRPAGDCTG